MGRKPKQKERKPLSAKARSWVRELLPLLQNRSLNTLTLDELSALLGKSKSTIYTYFSTKEEIYQTAIQLIIDDLAAVASGEMVAGDNMEAIYRSMLLKISEGIEGLSISFLEQIQLYYPRAWSIIEVFVAQLLDNFKQLYEKGMQSGEFKTYNISLLKALDNHFVMSIMTDSEKFGDQGMTLNDLVQQYLDLRIRALKGP
jgi:AcrR family transcriptional regulator